MVQNKESIIKIVPSTIHHADFLSNKLRDIDKREIWLNDVSADSVLHIPIIENHRTFTALLNDSSNSQPTPMCMFGTVPLENMPNNAIVWALGSNLIYKYKKSFYKASLDVVDTLQDSYSMLWNIVPHDHNETIIWLKRLGFEFGDEYIKLKNVPMLYFSRCNNQKSMATVH